MAGMGLLILRLGGMGCVFGTWTMASKPIHTDTHACIYIRTRQLTDIFYQIDLLLGPVLVILITWSFTYLAVALAEKQVWKP